MSGVERIAAERERQVAKEGWTPEHDDKHADGALVDAALVYASPRELYVKSEVYWDPAPGHPSAVAFLGVWPREWECKVDAGRTDGRGLDPSEVRRINAAKPARRIRELTKAGALIAAEIDRLERMSSAHKGIPHTDAPVKDDTK